MRKTLLGALCALALPILSYGQVCAVDPLVGSNWAFKIHTPSGGVAAIGTFAATKVGVQQNVNGVQTVNTYGQIARQESFAGRYTLDGDCRGGEILINVGRHSVQLQFYFANNRNEMEFVNDGDNYYLPSAIIAGRRALLRGDGVVFTGLARRQAGPAACGANTPLTTLNGKSFGFRTSNFGPSILASFLPIPNDTAVAGIFDASSLSGTGILAITETINREGILAGVPVQIFTPPGGYGVFRGIKTGGRYIVNPDCSGGEIMIMTNYQPIQYEFVFSGNNFNEMFLLSDSDGTMLEGVAKLF